MRDLLAFEIQIDKDVVRRVLARHYRPESSSNGPSLADVLGACDRQPVEHRPVPMRVSDAAQPLGARGHGPVAKRITRVGRMKSEHTRRWTAGRQS